METDRNPPGFSVVSHENIMDNDRGVAKKGELSPMKPPSNTENPNKQEWPSITKLCVNALNPLTINSYGKSGVDPFAVDALEYNEAEFIMFIRTVAKIAEMCKTAPNIMIAGIEVSYINNFIQ